MNPFRDKEEMIRILSALWTRIFETPEIVESARGAKLLVKFRFTDPVADFYIDIRGDSPRFEWDPERPDDPDVEMILSAETSHRFWLEDLNLPLALAQRKVIAKGSLQKALKLIPALKPAFPLYPIILEEMGRSDLLAQRPSWTQSLLAALPRWRMPRWRMPRLWWGARVDLASLPRFPLEVVDAAPEERPGEQATRAAVTDLCLLETMQTIRAFEQHLAAAFRAGELPTEAIHLSIGQEAVAAGVCLNLRDSDTLNTTHRGHGHIIAKGAELPSMMAELYGRAAGQCAGKGGSMHVTDRRRGILGANGIVGAGYLLAMGAGLAIKRQKRDDVSVVIAGDGSVNQGMFHEALNMAALFELPVLFVVENNLYGEFTSVERHSAVTEMHERVAKGYGIPSERLDGNDVRGIYGRLGEIIAQIRRDSRPRMVELMTYRWHGHMEGEPQLYRTAEEREAQQKRCPIASLERALLQGEDAVSEEQLSKIRAGAQAKVDAAVAFAKRAAPPQAEDLCLHVYAPEPRHHVEGNFAHRLDGGDISVAQAINQALAEEMARDEAVFLWGEDVTLGGYFSITEGLVDTFGTDRIIDTPISENGIIGGAVGAAMTGLRPVAEILFGDFLTCCVDPIVNQAAKLRYMTGGQVSVPLTIRTPVGRGVGLAAQHSQSMERYFFGIPGLMVVAPSDAYTAKGLLKTAIRSPNPILFFEHKLLYPIVGKIPAGEYFLPLGRARVLRTGRDVTIVTHLLGVSVALDAAQLLAARGIEAEVVDLVTLHPIDTATILESLRKTGRLVTLEEGSATGGIGSEVIARAAVAGHGLLRSPPIRLAAPECPVPYANNLEKEMMLDPDAIAARITAALDR